MQRQRAELGAQGAGDACQMMRGKSGMPSILSESMVHDKSRAAKEAESLSAYPQRIGTRTSVFGPPAGRTLCFSLYFHDGCVTSARASQK
eukprot:1550758-Karenia_brevis.AAC.1